MPVTYKAGDIFLVSGQGFFSKGIRYFTRDRKEAETRATHVGVVVTDGAPEMAMVVEALGHGVVQRRFIEGPGREAHAVYRPLNLSPGAIAVATALALRNVNRGYGWLKIGAQVADWLIPFRPGGHTVYLFRRAAGLARFPFCSYLADEVIAKALEFDLAANGIMAAVKPFGVERNCCSPDDIDDFVNLHPNLYETVKPW